MYYDTKNNLLAREWKDRYNSQSEEVKKQLDELKDMEAEGYQLNIIKKTRTPPKKGDVFIVNPQKDIYFLGSVINDQINNICGKDLLVVYIYKNVLNSIENIPSVIECEELLIPPVIIGKMYWTRGYFYNVNVDLINRVGKDYGFYSIMNRVFYDEYENILEVPPKHYGTFGIVTLTGIAKEISKELIIDSEFLGSKFELKNYKEGTEEDINERISPFYWSEEDEVASICLNAGTYLNEVFKTREGEGAVGNGYDWENLARIYLEEKQKDLMKAINFDSSADLFCAYSNEKGKLKEFITGFKEACEDKKLILDLFSKTKID